MATVLYHANCWDGFCAAWLARKTLPVLTQFIPVQYGQPFPSICRANDDDGQLYILDFSYKPEVLSPIIQAGHFKHVVIIDHHKSAQDYSVSMPDVEVVFDVRKSGARLTAEYFGLPSCGLIDYTEDRDMWWWKLPHSREVNANLRSYPLDFELWDSFGRFSAEYLCTFLKPGGEAILRREEQIVEDHVRHAVPIELGGYTVPSVNATVLFSEIAGRLAQDAPFGACYFRRSDGKMQWSLRSRPDAVDVSEIAKLYGGGGHRNAAGFEAA